MSHNEDTSYSNPNLHLSTASISSNNPAIPFKRPRSNSIPPSSPTGSTSSKRAISEDDFASSTAMQLQSQPQAQAPSTAVSAGDVDMSSQADDSAMTIEHDSGATMRQQPLATAAFTVPEEEGEGEVVRRTESVHIGDSGPNGSGNTEKYAELYNELLNASPPPYHPYHRYALIPSSLHRQLKSASFEPDSLEATQGVSLDMASLIEAESETELAEGEEVYVIETEPEQDEAQPGRYLVPRGKKERMWKLKNGLVEDEQFVYVTEAGWTKIASGLQAGGAEIPNLLRFCLQNGRDVQIAPQVYTLYLVADPNAVVSDSVAQAVQPIRFTCPSDTPLPLFLRYIRSLIPPSATSSSSKEKTSFRAWTFDPLTAQSNADQASLSALESLHLIPTLLPSLASSLVLSSGDRNSVDTCASKNFQDGDAFVLEFGTKFKGNSGAEQVDWILDLGSQGHAVAKPTINMPPVPTAPAPLFSKPSFFGGSAATGAGAGAGASGNSSSSSLVPEGFGMTTRSQIKREQYVRTRGLVGLTNLGNTCFMNSAVQCLSNTIELNKYFTSSVYRDEINRDNPLGMHGMIADAFGSLVEKLWSATPESSIAPRQLKGTTGRFAPQFAGYGQHDTQEFIAFLLDGLHEDLNRIIKKPYIEKPDWKAGGGDRELALLGKECWEGYKKRNDSVIVDLFQGQLMSTLVCPECHKESITMDPFMYLTVPLPIAQYRQFECRFYPRDPEADPLNIRMSIPANASFAQVKDKLGALVDANPAHMIGFDLWKGGVYQWWNDSDHNVECKQNDIAVFFDLGVPTTTSRRAVATIPTDGSITVPVYTFKTSEAPKYTRGNDLVPNECTLVPFFITLSRAEAGDAMAVRDAIARGYTRFLRPEMAAHLWVPNSSSHATVPMTPAEEESGENVAEIHLDSGAGANGNAIGTGNAEVKVVEVPPARSGANSPVNSLKGAHGNLSSASLATLASTKSGRSPGRLVPRGDLYKIHVADASTAEANSGSSGSFSFFKSKEKKEEGMHSVYRGSPSGAAASWSSLETRRKEKKKEKATVLGRITSGLFGGSSSASVKDDAEEGEGEKGHGRGRENALGQGSSSRAESPVAGASTPAIPNPLVVRPGEAIFVEWPSKKYYEYIDEVATSNRPAKEIIDPAIEKERLKKAAGRSISLDDCLDEFSKEETLGQEDLWYCPVCKKHQAASKKLDIYKAPDILVICIKRFGSSRRLSDKLDHMVHFPLEGLDLAERVGERKVAKALKFTKEQGLEYGMDLDRDLDDDEGEIPEQIKTEGADGGGDMVYDLYAVDNHFGGLGGGHYTAFCKNREDGQWWNFDDSRVSKASPASVQSKAAYLLFYRRRTDRPIGGISRVKAEEAESRAASRAVSPAPSADRMALSGSGIYGAGAGGGSSALRNQLDVSSSPDLQSSTATSSTDDLPSYDQSRLSPSAAPSPPNLMGGDDSSDEDLYGEVNNNDNHNISNANVGARSYRSRRIDSDSDEEDEMEARLRRDRLERAGQSIGFGNNAWSGIGSGSGAGAGTGAGTTTAARGVNFPFGLKQGEAQTQTQSQEDTEMADNVNADTFIPRVTPVYGSNSIPSPPDSQDGFEYLRSASRARPLTDNDTGNNITGTATDTAMSSIGKVGSGDDTEMMEEVNSGVVSASGSSAAGSGSGSASVTGEGESGLGERYNVV